MQNFRPVRCIGGPGGVSRALVPVSENVAQDCGFRRLVFWLFGEVRSLRRRDRPLLITILLNRLPPAQWVRTCGKGGLIPQDSAAEQLYLLTHGN